MGVFSSMKSESFKQIWQDKRRRIRPGTMIAGGFFLLILLGTLLLMLPISSRSGEATSLLTAAFTATSSVCVTGLILVDTYQYWSPFGQLVILLMIQIGGLGFMTVAAMFSLLARRSFTLRERMVMTASLNVGDLAGIVRLTRRILFGTLLFEGIGAVILSIRFMVDFGFKDGLVKGIFHSVTAFCNAGFDLMGSQGAFMSLMGYYDDPWVLTTIMALIIIGGLGFFVWGDLLQNRRKPLHALSLHTKLVLTTTGILLVGGTVLFYIYEFDNPLTMGYMTEMEKIANSMFQSVTTRTAGFNTINQGFMTGPSQALSMVLMFIGGSPGSTAGGVKTVTLAVLFITTRSTFQGKKYPEVFHRSISLQSIKNAISMMMMGLFLVAVGSFIIADHEQISFTQALFEAFSAFGTVGLTTGITPYLGSISQITLIALMYLGRVGILTMGFMVFNHRVLEPTIKYPESKVLVG